MANTLYEYYSGKLPSIEERGKTYEQQGLGSASTYTGSAGQNISLLGKLQQPKGDSNVSVIPPASGTAEINIPPALSVDTSELKNQLAGSITSLSTGLKNLQTSLSEYKKGEPKTGGEQLMEQRAELTEERPGLETYTDFLSEMGYTPEKLQEQQALQGKLVDYQKQVTDLELEKQTALGNRQAAMQGRATSAWIGESALIERQYNSRISAVAAKGTLVQMEYEFAQNNLENAFRLSDTYMDYAMYEYDQKMADLTFIRDVYYAEQEAMTKTEQEEWDRAWKISEVERDDYWKQANYELNVFKANQTADKALTLDEIQDIKDKYDVELPYGTTKSGAERILGGGFGEYFEDGVGYSGYIEPAAMKLGSTDVNSYASAIENGQFVITDKNAEGDTITVIDWSKIPQNIRDDVYDELEGRGMFKEEPVGEKGLKSWATKWAAKAWNSLWD